MRVVRSLAVLLVLAAPLAAQETGGYVVRLGRDTTAVARFTKTATRIDEVVATRTPRALLRTYTWELSSTGEVTRVAMTTRRPDEAESSPGVMRQVLTFRGDSAVIESRRDTLAQTRRYAVARGAIPLGFPSSWMALEIATTRAARMRQDSVRFPAWWPADTDAEHLDVVRLSKDSVSVRNTFDTWHARVDGRGRVRATVPVHGGTEQFAIQRVAAMDVQAIAVAWARGEQQGGATGQLSPRDTVRATVGSAQLLVDYGRPSRRGRVIFGNVVPWGQLWRTGANQATQFRTDRALEIGGVVLEPGLYTLWTIPGQAGWKLIVNAQTGQWGTEHDPARDLYQLDMRVAPLAQPVDTFMIAITPEGPGGVLRLRWENTEASIPFTVR